MTTCHHKYKHIIDNCLIFNDLPKNNKSRTFSGAALASELLIKRRLER